MASRNFRRGLMFWCHPERQRDRTALPGKSQCFLRCLLSLPSQRSSPDAPCGFRRRAHRLSTDCPLPHYGVLITRATTRAPGTNPAAVVVPALVSVSSLSHESSVGELVAQHGKHVSRCGLPAVLLDARDLTLSVNRLAVSGLESRSYPYRETVACSQCHRSIDLWHKSRHRLSRSLPASDYSPFMVELFTFKDLL